MRRYLGEKFDLDVEKNMSLFAKIYDDEEVIGAVQNRLESHYKEIKRYAVKLLKGRWRALTKLPSIDVLCAMTLCLMAARRRFLSAGFSDGIFFDTMSDVKIWGEDCKAKWGGIGLREINWLRLHISCEIFKIGRLQYQLSRCYFNTGKDGGIRLGEKCFNIHIPRGESLDTSKCVESLRQAVDILGKVFPKVKLDIMICHSWMLGKCNALFIKDGSNISRFASMFRIVGESNCASEHFRWIFGLDIDDKILQNNKVKYGYYYDLSDFSPNTSLQERAKDYIMNGGELKDGKGILDVSAFVNV